MAVGNSFTMLEKIDAKGNECDEVAVETQMVEMEVMDELGVINGGTPSCKWIIFLV